MTSPLNLEELRFNQRDASQLYCGNSPSLFRFTKLCSPLQFNNNCLCYFTDISTQNPDTRYISMCYLRLCLARIVYLSGP